MEIHANFDEPVTVHTSKLDWVPSPMQGVDRRMLDRIGGEVARATSIVRYAEASSFPEHTHSGGEEFIVLEGVFQDEHGDYPAGTYVRNPVGTHHVPGSAPGCTIFVKLWQFDPVDQEQMSVDLNSVELSADPARPGVQHKVLADRDYESVSLESWERRRTFEIEDTGGFEILILEGELSVHGVAHSKHDWIRWPANRTARFMTGETGARVWIKRGHLSEIRVPEQA